MTPEQAEQVLALLPEILDYLRFIFTAIAVGTGFMIAGFFVLFLTKH